MVKRFPLTRFANPVIPQDLATKAYVDSGGGSSPLTTKGDLFGFSSVDARIPIGTNDFILTADSAQALGLKWAAASGGSGNTFARVVKKTDETVTSSETLQDDNELLFVPSINKTYAFQLFLLINSGATPDFKCAFTLPTGGTGIWTTNAIFRNDTPTNSGNITSSDSSSTNGTNQYLMYSGLIIMSSTSGTVNYQWAQNNSDASDTKVLQGSYLVVWEET